MKIGKRGISLLLAMLMLFGVFPLNALAAEAETVENTAAQEMDQAEEMAAEIWDTTEPVAGLLSRATLTITDPTNVKGSNYTKSAKMAAALDSIFAGHANIYRDSGLTKEVLVKLGTKSVPNNGVSLYTSGGYNSGTSCWIYAVGVYYTLFRADTRWQNSEKITSVSGESTASYATFQAAGIRQEVGALLRTSTHALILLGYDQNGLSVVHGNADGQGLVRIDHYTWSNFNADWLSGVGKTMSYFVQPTDTYYYNNYSSITLSASSLTMEALTTRQLTATVTPANVGNPAIRWTSSNTAVATVDANGKVTARGKGTATITAASTDGTNVSASCTVTVTNNAYIVTDPAQLESSHPYAVNCTDFWIYTEAGAENLAITFDAQTEFEDGSDYLRIYDGAGNLIGSYTGRALAGSTVEIPGDTVKIQISSGKSGTAWGFKANKAVEPSVEWNQASISLAGDIGVNYYAQLSDDIVADEGAYIQFTVAGQTQTVPLSEAEVSADGTYRFTCKVAAKQMTEEITGQMYLSDGTAVGEAKVYSVKAYCDAAIPVYSQNADLADLVGLLEAMLNYGGYSQTQFGYNTDNLANADLNIALPTITESDVDAYAHGTTGSEDGISVASVSLLLESTTTIRFYFELDGSKSIDEYTFYVDGVETSPIESNGQYYVDKVNVAAKDLDEMVTVTIGGLTVKYCGLSYVRQVAVLYPSYYSEALVNVAKALYAYNQAANAYFA